MNGGGYAYALSRIQPELVYHAQAQDMEALDDDDFNLQSFSSHDLEPDNGPFGMSINPDFELPFSPLQSGMPMEQRQQQPLEPELDWKHDEGQPEPLRRRTYERKSQPTVQGTGERTVFDPLSESYRGGVRNRPIFCGANPRNKPKNALWGTPLECLRKGYYAGSRAVHQ